MTSGGRWTAVVPVPGHGDGVRSRRRGQFGAHTHGESGAGDHVAPGGAADAAEVVLGQFADARRAGTTDAPAMAAELSVITPHP